MVSVCSRLAGTVTPFVAGSIWAASPLASLLLYATASALCAAVLTAFVDDTRERPMPDELVSLTDSADVAGWHSSTRDEPIDEAADETIHEPEDTFAEAASARQ